MTQDKKLNEESFTFVTSQRKKKKKYTSKRSLCANREEVDCIDEETITR